MDKPCKEMPKYECHKVVWALKIKEISGTLITPEETDYSPIEVSSDFIERHRPHVGGYYIVYRDGYTSYSPAKAFEEGYKPV